MLSKGVRMWYLILCFIVSVNLFAEGKDVKIFPRILLEEESSVIHVVIPMAGDAPRFQQAGFKQPKPFIPVGGKKMIAWVVENMIPKKIPINRYELKFHLIIR